MKYFICSSETNLQTITVDDFLSFLARWGPFSTCMERLVKSVFDPYVVCLCLSSVCPSVVCRLSLSGVGPSQHLYRASIHMRSLFFLFPGIN
jgi:hypothetical protein